MRYLYSVEIPLECKVEVALINRIINKLVIQSPQVSIFEEKGKHIIRCLFLKLMENDNVHTLLPNDWKEYLRQDDSPANRARVVTDYISGMTDGYAQKAYARLFLASPRIALRGALGRHDSILRRHVLRGGACVGADGFHLVYPSHLPLSCPWDSNRRRRVVMFCSATLERSPPPRRYIIAPPFTDCQF